jgi:hypothetical protein
MTAGSNNLHLIFQLPDSKLFVKGLFELFRTMSPTSGHTDTYPNLVRIVFPFQALPQSLQFVDIFDSFQAFLHGHSNNFENILPFSGPIRAAATCL